MGTKNLIRCERSEKIAMERNKESRNSKNPNYILLYKMEIKTIKMVLLSFMV